VSAPFAESADLLERIVGRRRERYGVSGAPGRGVPAVVEPGAAEISEAHPFVAALAARRGRAAIAEVKLGSPRLGALAGRVDPERQAAAYRAGGAAALSVVVEPDFFFGSWELLHRCKGASGLPAIAKDFLVHERQLDEALAAGADAILLIASLHPADDLRAWAAAARARGLAPLVEIHDESDLERLAGAAWELVGVNNRNLRTFEVELERATRLAPRLPVGALRVAESGIARRDDVMRLAGAGFDAFLVGERLLLAPDPAAALAELFG
jgi:indole-3-glycerol phosphate synthase